MDEKAGLLICSGSVHEPVDAGLHCHQEINNKLSPYPVVGSSRLKCK